MIDGLKTLEYRGYDSAGIYLNDIGAVKAVGEVENLRKRMREIITATATEIPIF